VIAILGIIAVAAIPKIFSLTNEATTASVDGIVGGIKTGIALYTAQQMAQTGLETFPANFDDVPDMTDCSTANPCFYKILKDPITDSKWRKIGGNNYDYSPGPAVRHFMYNAGTGEFWES